MDSYDKWKLGLDKDDRHKCDHCEQLVDHVYDDTDGDEICEDCSENYEMCTKCDVIIVSDQEYCHDEYCDACCDKIADRLLDND